MIATLKDSKAKLSSLVDRASRGEEIVITVRGQPKARLMPVSAAGTGSLDRVKWMRRLRAMSKKACIGIHDSTDIFEDIRSDRV
jgi:prevent-host-death family protein